MKKTNALSRLCVHTQTTKPWDLNTCIKEYHKAGIQHISIWRHVLENHDLKAVKSELEKHNLQVTSLVRGGFFPSVSKSIRQDALEDNKKTIKEAAAIGAELVVLVCGSDPQQNLETSRMQIKESIQDLIPYAKSANVRLAIEPLHPMYAGDKSAVVSMAQANDLAEHINDPFLGVAIDVYHLWWDPMLEQEIERCGKQDNIFAFHVCDWRTPTVDMLTDRGLMGEGCIPVQQIRQWVEAAGFKGPIEVEIFSERLWKQNQTEFLEKIKLAYIHHT
ncbi:MAG: sugar phosphate isomerase/epimerase [Flavobacteriaceae bacterium]|jgi:sugar phosphate isomerase/epimerase|tara:strand:+ start:9135 stop:9962 length:828 start_codon:yes stop_codon:yes gene_type:complete